MARALAASGLIRPTRPDKVLVMALEAGRWGISHAAAVAAAAVAVPGRLALIGDSTSLTYSELDRRSSAVARGLIASGIGPGDQVGLLARNSVEFVLAALAVAKVGANLLYLNTGFAPPTLKEVLDGESAAAVISDPEFASAVEEASGSRLAVCTFPDGAPAAWPSLAELAERGSGLRLPAVRHSPAHVILTSGTTGSPKGAARSGPGPVGGLASLLALLSRIPLRAEGTSVIAAPMFHAWGFLHLTLGLILRSTMVVHRRFDPADTLRLAAKLRADALVVVPVMLQRMLELPQARAGLRLPDLRVIATSGSALPAPLARAAAEAFGPVLYNLYGSTEVAFVSVADPQDLVAAPGSVGRALPTVRLAVLDETGRRLPAEQSGELFVRSPLSFSGYTGGADRKRVGGLVATGDIAHLDRAGRLWIDGRQDDMIISGGENVFPGEVEQALRTHPAVADVAVVGVPDSQFGARLVAYVVPRHPVAPTALRDFVKGRLASYKVPREVHIRQTLPRNETGKVVKAQLLAEHLPG